MNISLRGIPDGELVENLPQVLGNLDFRRPKHGRQAAGSARWEVACRIDLSHPLKYCSDKGLRRRCCDWRSFPSRGKLRQKRRITGNSTPIQSSTSGGLLGLWQLANAEQVLLTSDENLAVAQRW